MQPVSYALIAALAFTFGSNASTSLAATSCELRRNSYEPAIHHAGKVRPIDITGRSGDVTVRVPFPRSQGASHSRNIILHYIADMHFKQVVFNFFGRFFAFFRGFI